MRSNPLTRWMMIALAIVVTAACATTPEEEVRDEVVVQVQNNILPPASLTVWLVPQTGVRQMVGTVSPSDTAEFTMDLTATPERYVLLAETTAGAELQSNPFTLTAGTDVTWDVALNAVRLR